MSTWNLLALGPSVYGVESDGPSDDRWGFYDSGFYEPTSNPVTSIAVAALAVVVLVVVLDL